MVTILEILLPYSGVYTRMADLVGPHNSDNTIHKYCTMYIMYIVTMYIQPIIIHSTIYMWPL